MGLGIQGQPGIAEGSREVGGDTHASVTESRSSECSGEMEREGGRGEQGESGTTRARG